MKNQGETHHDCAPTSGVGTCVPEKELKTSEEEV
jgi:hypothetical protein